jgi:hypothetical protein
MALAIARKSTKYRMPAMITMLMIAPGSQRFALFRNPKVSLSLA